LDVQHSIPRIRIERLRLTAATGKQHHHSHRVRRYFLTSTLLPFRPSRQTYSPLTLSLVHRCDGISSPRSHAQLALSCGSWTRARPVDVVAPLHRLNYIGTFRYSSSPFIGAILHDGIANTNCEPRKFVASPFTTGCHTRLAAQQTRLEIMVERIQNAVQAARSSRYV
jgi:hypothetical protein